MVLVAAYCYIRAVYSDDASSVDGDDQFIVSAGNPGGKANYQVDYTAISKTDLQKEMAKEIGHVASALSLNVSRSLGTHGNLYAR